MKLKHLKPINKKLLKQPVKDLCCGMTPPFTVEDILTYFNETTYVFDEKQFVNAIANTICKRAAHMADVNLLEQVKRELDERAPALHKHVFSEY